MILLKIKTSINNYLFSICIYTLWVIKKDSSVVPFGNRIKSNFSPDRIFTQQNTENEQELNYDDSLWNTHSTPHNFNDIDTFDDLSLGERNSKKNVSFEVLI